MSSTRARKRRHRETDHLETIAQVRPERSGLDRRPKRPVRGRDDSDVDAAGEVLTDAPHLAFLDHPEELRLRAGCEFAHLVEEQRALVSLFEQALALADRPGERAARVTEQLRLDQFIGESRAVERAEGSMAPRTEAVNGARHQLLS